MSRWAIADIHGCKNTFRKLLKEIKASKRDHLILLGDYIDRAPDSAGVIDGILSLQESGFDVTALRGNHEDMFLRAKGYSDQIPALSDPEMVSSSEKGWEWLWHRNGGKFAEDSFEASGKPLQRYIDFALSTVTYAEEPDVILVHAGLSWYNKDPFGNYEALLWSRQKYSGPAIHKKTVISGHTITSLPAIRKSVEEKHLHIILDNGCHRGSKGSSDPDYGNLVAMNLDTWDLVAVPYCEETE